MESVADVDFGILGSLGARPRARAPVQRNCLCQ